MKGPMDCNLPDSSAHGILRARILECVAIPFFRGSSPPRAWWVLWGPIQLDTTE